MSPAHDGSLDAYGSWIVLKPRWAEPLDAPCDGYPDPGRQRARYRYCDRGRRGCELFALSPPPDAFAGGDAGNGALAGGVGAGGRTETYSLDGRVLRGDAGDSVPPDRKSTRLNSSHLGISYA